MIGCVLVDVVPSRTVTHVTSWLGVLVLLVVALLVGVAIGRMRRWS